MDTAGRLARHIKRLRECRLCPQMHGPVVSGGLVVSEVLLVGQAPGDKEPKLGRPFAWTAGKTLFRWFKEAAGVSEEQFRSCIYMAAVCRCFPGKAPEGGDRVPSPQEILNCSIWLKRELDILQPELVIPVGKLAIAQFLPLQKLDQIIGRKFEMTRCGHRFDIIPLPHPSGASPWHRKEPGKNLLKKALRLIVKHPAFNFQNSGINSKEIFQVLLLNKKFKIEQITSWGQATEKGKWLKEPRDEWVAVLEGSGWLRFRKGGRLIKLKAGDHVSIPAQTSHRVEWTSPDEKTIWLAVYS